MRLADRRNGKEKQREESLQDHARHVRSLPAPRTRHDHGRKRRVLPQFRPPAPNEDEAATPATSLAGGE